MKGQCIIGDMRQRLIECDRQKGDLACALPGREQYLKAMEGVNREFKFDSQIDM
jgi:hypothetical protein